ncbi:hypothetical protein [Microvirga sp. VF16]|uniref:hypothetical protein n=1 Tax=Microvirga sp. VF16 TaxID=2807101 RepID=UPI00193E1C28|nr:hypothetical protein [Microvirga sp. VF16]
MTIEIGPVAGLSEPVTFDLEQLTKVIRLLGQARARMVEGIQKQPLDGKTVETILKPTWHIQVAHIDGSLLAFDHPLYGPVAFAIPRDEVARIVNVLSKHLELPASQPENPS